MLSCRYKYYEDAMMEEHSSGDSEEWVPSGSDGEEWRPTKTKKKTTKPKATKKATKKKTTRKKMTSKKTPKKKQRRKKNEKDEETIGTVQKAHSMAAGKETKRKKTQTHTKCGEGGPATKKQKSPTQDEAHR
mmetsp:Transcript_803/g.1549  ORF Transcript_803/g.1549 Transcript_803/m.1549 type:complete len:132 (+) Transcript_803:25-420(+)